MISLNFLRWFYQRGILLYRNLYNEFHEEPLSIYQTMVEASTLFRLRTGGAINLTIITEFTNPVFLEQVKQGKISYMSLNGWLTNEEFLAEGQRFITFKPKFVADERCYLEWYWYVTSMSEGLLHHHWAYNHATVFELIVADSFLAYHDETGLREDEAQAAESFLDLHDKWTTPRR